jgi:hypothetical protein
MRPWLVIALAVGCSTTTEPDGTYVGTVSFTGTNTAACVPTTITLTFQSGKLVSVDGNSSFSYTGQTDGMPCTADVSDGDGAITCGGNGGEVSCADGGTVTTGATTLTLTDGGMMGTIATNVQAMVPPGCAADVLCAGSGSVVFDKK